MTLVAKNVSVRRGSNTILDDVSLRFEAGTMTAIVGPNGAGKSTLLHALAGLDASSSGSVEADAVDVSTESRAALAKRVSMMTQHAESPPLRVLEVVLLGRSASLGSFGVVSDSDVRLAEESLADVGISELSTRSFPTLSGGERQRAMFALQTVQRAPNALFDEPTSAQDFAGTKRMIEVLRRRAAAGDAVVAVIHDLNIALRGFDRIVCLHLGRVVSDGAPETVIADPALSEAFEEAVVVERTEAGLVVLADL